MAGRAAEVRCGAVARARRATAHRLAAGLLAAAVLLLPPTAGSQPVPASPPVTASQPALPTPDPRALDLLEEVHRLPVTARNAGGQEVRGAIALTSFRPPGFGPFPLVVMNHGRAIAERRAQQGRQRYEVLARYLVSKGFAVIVPTRLGYGDTYGQSDPEDGGSCSALRAEAMALAASDQVLAAVDYARTLPWVDATRWVAIGQSVGGLATLGTAWRRPPGLVAAINFSGGTGGNPDRRPRDPCSPQRQEDLWRARGGESVVPTLWIYWRNDLYWGEQWPERWARAWNEGGGLAEFHHLPPVGADGHAGLTLDMDRWVPIVEAFLARAGFPRPGLVERPPPSGYASIDDVARVPASRAGRDLYETRFLPARPPRAFAIGPGGVSGWAAGDWARGRALGFCQATRGVSCKLYAVDDDVVWAP